MQNLILSPIDPDYLIESIAERIAEKLSLHLPSNDKPIGPLRMKQAASYLGVSLQTLYAFVHQGKLKPHKAGKFNLFYHEDLDRFIRGEKPEQNEPTHFLKMKNPAQ